MASPVVAGFRKTIYRGDSLRSKALRQCLGCLQQSESVGANGFNRAPAPSTRTKQSPKKLTDPWAYLPTPQAPETPMEIGRPLAWTIISATVSATPVKFRK